MWSPSQWFSASFARKSRTAVFQESLSGFMSNALTSGISWQNTHFSILTVARFLWTQSIILGFHFILVASITVTWASSFSGLRFKLEIPYSPEKLSKLARKYLFCFQQKVFRVLFFLILFSCGMYLFQVCWKRSQNGYIFLFLYYQVAYNCSN